MRYDPIKFREAHATYIQGKYLLRQQIFSLLDELEPGGPARDFNRSRISMKHYLTMYQRQTRNKKIFHKRQSPQPGWTRVWRLE